MSRKRPGRETAGVSGPGAVRISAGKWKGRALDVPQGARPTSARAREALFDILGPRVHGARVLDLHAGSGAVGLEAISRGAEHAVLVDRDAAAARGNVERLGASGSVEVLASDAAAAERLLRSRGGLFDIVFSDPPYGAGSGGVDLASLLAPEGVLVVQTDAGTALEPPPDLRPDRARAYGRNVFHFFRRAEGPAPR